MKGKGIRKHTKKSVRNYIHQRTNNQFVNIYEMA